MFDIIEAYKIFVEVIENEEKTDKFLCFACEIAKIDRFLGIMQTIKMYYACYEKYFGL